MNELANMATMKQLELEKKKGKDESEKDDGMTKRPRDNMKHRAQRSSSVPAAQVRLELLLREITLRNRITIQFFCRIFAHLLEF